MKVNYENPNKPKVHLKNGDVVQITDGAFYIVFEESSAGFRLNSLSGVGYYGDYKTREELNRFIERKMATDTWVSIFPSDEYELNLQPLNK